MTGQAPILRRLGDAAVVFDARSWQTHLLPPSAAVVADLIDELRESGPLTRESLDAALRADLDLDPEAPDIRELLRMFSTVGLLDA
jgi:PqqD family protein of HPr-rel-A system